MIISLLGSSICRNFRAWVWIKFTHENSVEQASLWADGDEWGALHTDFIALAHPAHLELLGPLALRQGAQLDWHVFWLILFRGPCVLLHRKVGALVLDWMLHLANASLISLHRRLLLRHDLLSVLQHRCCLALWMHRDFRRLDRLGRLAEISGVSRTFGRKTLLLLRCGLANLAQGVCHWLLYQLQVTINLE